MTIREIALAIGFVDTKVCAVDEGLVGPQTRDPQGPALNNCPVESFDMRDHDTVPLLATRPPRR